MPKEMVRTTIIVFLSHILVLFFLFLVGDWGSHKLPKKNILVKNIVIKENKKEPLLVEKNQSEILPPEKTNIIKKKVDLILEEKAIEKKVESKEEKREISADIKKGEIKKSLPSAKKKKEVEIKKRGESKKEASVITKKEKRVTKEVIDNLQKSFSNLDKPLLLKKSIDKKLSKNFSLEISRFKEGNEKEGPLDVGDFQGRLTEFFKSHLKLPEYGEVKIKMQVKSDGTMGNLLILSSKNKKNEEYLKSSLPKMFIPWLKSYLVEKEEMDLVICFTNDIR
jgi:hypothetical protein